MTRRCQQDELYAAEGTVRFKGRTFKDREDVQRYVDDLRENWWWQLWYGKIRRVEVWDWDEKKITAPCWFEEQSAGVMPLHPTWLNELAVLHELAHIFTDFRYGANGHGPWFARTYLEVVSLAAGPKVFSQLFEAFQQGGIEHNVDTPQQLPHVWIAGKEITR